MCAITAQLMANEHAEMITDHMHFFSFTLLGVDMDMSFKYDIILSDSYSFSALSTHFSVLFSLHSAMFK